MEKLAAADASFLYSETNRCTSNVASVQLMELPEAVTPSAFIASLKQYMSERLHLLTYLSRKLAFVPGNLDHPVWIADENFSIDNHIIAYPVALPGGRQQLEDAVALIHNIKMPLDRPLWAMYVLTGLEGGKVAYYNQAHHAALDGASGNAAFKQLMDETPEHPPVPAPESTSSSHQVTALELIENSMRNFYRFQLENAERMLGAAETSRRLVQRAFDPNKDFGAFGKLAPATPFNTQISDKRAWRTGEIPLAEVKAMGKVTGTTVNDIVMAICAGGLRTYLERKGALPEQSLIAGCPVSLRKPDDPTPGNQVTMMNVELGTQIADPLERIAAINASAIIAKEVTADLASAFEANASVPGMPTWVSAAINANESWGVANFASSPINVVISNVPGPRNTLYSNGARMTTHYPVSIVTQGLALNITVQSYTDQVYLGITACARVVPDADLLRDDMLAAFHELKKRLLPQNVSELKPREPIAAPATAKEQAAEVDMPQDRVA